MAIRVYQCFTRAVFEQVENLAVLGGDAMAVLAHHVAPGSVHSVFVNFPEPAQQNGGEDSQGKHILTQVRLAAGFVCWRLLLLHIMSKLCISIFIWLTANRNSSI